MPTSEYSKAHRFTTKAVLARVAILVVLVVGLILVFAVFKAHQRIGDWLDWYEPAPFRSLPIDWCWN